MVPHRDIGTDPFLAVEMSASPARLNRLLSVWFAAWMVRFHFVVAVGAILQAAFILLAVWARRHLGRNWSGEVRIGVDHQLLRTGPYRLLRHPIYTAMLGMFLGTVPA